MRPKTLITDFDNTLYDWFHVWYQSFSAMIAEVVRISGISEDVLFPEIREIHQKYRTSEYAFLLEEIPALRERYPAEDITHIFDDAIHAYRSARKHSLALYPGVEETLIRLRQCGVQIVLYTESLAYYTNFRVKRLGLDPLIDYVYSPPDHELPDFFLPKASLNAGNGDAVLAFAEHRNLPPGVVKPDPEVLLDIVKDVGREPTECIYLGDSLMKDIAMAQAALVTDVFAAYGGVQHKEEYELLRKVSHWTDDDVEREKQVSRMAVSPNRSIECFAEIAEIIGE